MAVNTIDWPRELFTLSDWDNLDPDEGHHIECVEGVLVVAPRPVDRHQKIMVRLTALLDQHLPPDLTAVPDVDVLLRREPLTIRAPDVVVTRLALYDTGLPRYPADEVRLAVEIVSPGSRGTDRVMKASEYAEAGIGEYWILEGRPLTLSVHVLDSGVYRLVDTHVGTAELTVCGVPLRIDLEALTRRPTAG